MAVLDQNNSNDPNFYDLSFMYTLQCDIVCPFCMYNSGPDLKDTLDLAALKNWLAVVPMDRIASFGLYGGEPGIDLEGFGKCLDIALEFASNKPCFVITNGTWSTDQHRTDAFIDFCVKYHLFLVVSGTPFHRKHQNRRVLEILKEFYPDAIRLKPLEENYHPMGRLEGRMKNYHCTEKCKTWNRALRIAVKPDGNILFQNCDGCYPIVGSLADDFSVIDRNVQELRNKGLTVCLTAPQKNVKISLALEYRK
jgi:hypothetical protein